MIEEITNSKGTNIKIYKNPKYLYHKITHIRDGEHKKVSCKTKHSQQV